MPKIAEARRRIAQSGREVWLEVDGGVNLGNLAAIARAGATVRAVSHGYSGEQAASPARSNIKLYTDIDPLQTSGNSCFSGNVPETMNFGFRTDTRTNNGQTATWASITWGTDDGFKGQPPEGLWRMTAQDLPSGTEKSVAMVDLAKGYPFDGDGKASMYVPRLKLTRDADKKITSIDLLFYTWNVTAYVPASAVATARVISRLPSVTLTDFSPPTGAACGWMARSCATSGAMCR